MHPARYFLALAILLGTPQTGYGQWSGDLSGGVGSDAGRLAIAVPWRLTVGQRLVLGVGPRLSYYLGAPASYRNKGRVTPGLPGRIQIDPDLVGLNLMVLAEFKVVRQVGLGANLDLAGVAAGVERSAGSARITPASGSLFLYGDKDRGSLNSEFYLSVAPTPAWTIRGGFSHYITGYTGKAGGVTTRYLRFDSVPFLAVGWRW